MQILDEESKAYFNFINALNSESTRNSYKFCLEKFLIYNKLDLASFLKLPTEEMSNLIIKYLVDKKISRGYKNLVTATLKHLCEINDIVLNWKKIKKFIISLWTSQAKEYSLDKENTSYDDLLDPLRVSLIGYKIE
jgi:hypothetical protein